MGEDIVADPNVGSHVPIHQQAVPSITARHERPYQDRHEKYVGDRRRKDLEPGAYRAEAAMGNVWVDTGE